MNKSEIDFPVPEEIATIAMPTQEDCNEVVALYNAGRKAELEIKAKQLIERYPESGLSWKFWGAAQQLLEQDCIPALQKTVELMPRDFEAHNLLGMALSTAGKKSEAEASFRHALELNPNFAAACCNLANCLADVDRFEEAEAQFRFALSIDPNIAEAYQNLGVLYKKQGRLEDAKLCAIRALQIKPTLVDAQFNLGALLSELNDPAGAEASYRAALAIQPTHIPSLIGLGNILARRGELQAAEELFRLSMSVDPTFTEAHIGLSLTLFDQDRLEAAEAVLGMAIKVKPDGAIPYSNLGTVLMRQHRLDDAVAAFRKALELSPGDATTYNGLASALNNSGRPAEAEIAFRKAIECDPTFAGAYSNLLAMLNFRPEARGEEIVELARSFDRQFCLPYKASWPVHTNSRDPNRADPNRRLRIGYVSPDFRHHAVAYFLEPILAHHDKTQVEVFGYSGVKVPDEYTERFQRYADHWHSTRALNDEALARLIQEEQIDILVDLAGHTDGNRLHAFARRPAPVQMTYLGYPGTTGLSTMDFRVVDAHAAPEGIAEADYTERLLRMPNSLWCYQPTPDMPELAPLPALQHGYLTFGSFNNFNKMDPATMDLWAELLRAIPSARLMMVTVPPGEVRQRLTRQFGELGIDAARLEFHGKCGHSEFHRKFLEVDISLDPVNVNGATTTCESLWMGVPVITLVGRRFLTRAGLSLLNAAGVGEFAAHSRADYIRIASELANDLPRLAVRRAGMRERLRASPLTDAAGFTRNLENLYREAWKRWCAGEI